MTNEKAFIDCPLGDVIAVWKYQRKLFEPFGVWLDGDFDMSYGETPKEVVQFCKESQERWNNNRQ